VCYNKMFSHSQRQNTPILPHYMISDLDSRAIVRLLGNTAAVEGGLADKKRFLMNGLCALVKADAWVWSLGTWKKPGDLPVYAGVMHGGFDEDRFTKLLNAVEHKDSEKIGAQWITEVTSKKMHTTYSLKDLDEDSLFSDSELADLFKHADIGEFFISGYPIDESSMSAISVYRACGAAPFSPRELKIAHLLFKEIPWLHMACWSHETRSKVPQLSPRQRVVLNLLLDGQGRKQIASDMQLSENTVSGYIKDLYKHFAVNSHAHLMSKFLVGNTYTGGLAARTKPKS